MDRKEVENVINEYRQSGIQSEAEISSKLIFPLLKALGYPSANIAQEFSVYGYAGRNKLPAKKADFIAFDDSSFASYNKNTQRSLAWVYEHSLLIVESKAPGEMSDDLGQVRFYTAWTRAVAYIETDGERLLGFYYNPINKDYAELDEGIDMLASCDNLKKFSFEEVSSIKQTGCMTAPLIVEQLSVEELDTSSFPSGEISYMRAALGRNVEGSTDAEVVVKFLNTTNTILENDLRYDIPKYTLDIPRKYYNAVLYIDNAPAPTFEGELIVRYWEDYDIYSFSSDSIDFEIMLIEGEQAYMACNIHIADSSVSSRLCNIDKIRKCFGANHLYLVDNDREIVLRLSMGTEGGAYWSEKEETLDRLNMSELYMKALKEIEDYYEIKFELRKLDDNEVDYYDDAITVVHNGILKKENVYILGPANTWPGDFELDEIMLLENISEERSETFTLFNIEFTSYKSYLLPGKYKKKKFMRNKKRDLQIPVCCEYKVSNELIV